ncbi:MAG: hypothetical protein EOO24_36180 [Comamonadaceae bacterium]|nr:MAG: hypothetical protein EOO24_36180 [Comamonadaceae bacterium]
MQDTGQVQAPPDAALIGRLLARLDVAVQPAALADACARTAATLPNVRPAEWLRHVLVQAGLKGLAPLQLGWRRFDQRRLPALVLHADRWFLAEPGAVDAVQLTDAAGVVHEASQDALQDALVLWLRPPAARRGAGPDALADNLAARLVWKELFRETGWVTKVLVATVLVNLLAIGTSLFAMQVYDRVVPTLAYATLTTLAAGMVLVVLLDWVLKTTRTIPAARVVSVA